MAAFKRKGRKTYEIEPTVPGVGYLGRLSTGQRDRRLAGQMETMLHTLAMDGNRDLVQMVKDRRLKLGKLWQAYLDGTLEDLRRERGDPLLADVVEAYRPLAGEREATGLNQLLELAPLVEQRKADQEDRPPRVLRLSWLAESEHLTLLYAAAVAEGRKANSVRRSLHRAVAGVLKHKLGRGKMLAVITDAEVPGELDERVVSLTLEEVQALIQLADLEFRPVLGLALATGIDLGPLLAMRIRDYDEAVGTLVVPDHKTGARPRTLVLRGEPVLENAEIWLRQLIAGRKASDPLLPVSRSTVRRRWADIRERAEREDVRWKDLRGVFATYYLVAGGSPRTLQLVLGHSTMAMTLRYLRRIPIGRLDDLRERARKMGLPGETHLALVGGS